MNKLSALSKLASAYHTLQSTLQATAGSGEPFMAGDGYAMDILVDSFGYIRRSLRIEDLKPVPKCTEGFNGKGPTHF